MNEQPAAKLDELEEAMMFVSMGGGFGNAAWLCRATGEVLWHSDEAEDFGPIPQDIDEEDRYIAIPDTRELDLGTPLALEFARRHLPECYAQVHDIFAHRGAYARFKDLLDHHGKLDAWYQWEQEKTQEALREWCTDNGIKLAE